MPELVEPTTRLYAAWRAARDEWGPGVHEDGFGIRADDDVETEQGFQAWVHRLHRAADPTEPLRQGQAHSSRWWIVDGDTLLGAIALRHELDARALDVGQVGYGIRPSARGRGLATWALGEVLSTARTRGFDRVLIVCADDNAASLRVIERHGGVLEQVRDSELGRIRRYSVAIGPSGS